MLENKEEVGGGYLRRWRFSNVFSQVPQVWVIADVVDRDVVSDCGMVIAGVEDVTDIGSVDCDAFETGGNVSGNVEISTLVDKKKFESIGIASSRLGPKIWSST